MIVEAHALSPSNPDYGAAEEMMGLGGRRGISRVHQGLANYTAGRLRDKAAIQKEKRKAGEEARLKPGPKGGAAAK